ncbi:helix-turn-helix domain-containing protein [Aristophania vespae]|uniref:helix-turn-helix domain-containing protein n=1 Tax=Aristophania vespae TaxID=2697033 RepID=UPI0023516D33|nr:helix-turn-helix domain-containing protein [Aristophania vespae]UMM63166.1 hypothetical protein DM15PD_01210 [Aristophania vespae]
MSNKAINWAIKVPASPTQKHLLLVLANFANDAGYTWPSTRLLVNATGLSERTIRKAKNDLTLKGYIKPSREFCRNCFKLITENKMAGYDEKTELGAGFLAASRANKPDCNTSKAALNSAALYNPEITPNNLNISPIFCTTNNISSSELEMKLPDWLPLDAWNGWLEMRKRKKTPLTPRAIELTLRKLSEFQKQGYNVGSILDTSTERGWTGVFEPRECASFKTKHKPPLNPFAGFDKQWCDKFESDPMAQKDRQMLVDAHLLRR